MRECEICGNPIEREGYPPVCSRACYLRYCDRKERARELHRYAARGIVRVTTQCEYCGREFERWSSRPKKYCSERCSSAASRRAVRERKQAGTYEYHPRPVRKVDVVSFETATCAWCEEVFEYQATRKRAPMYCSQQCSRKAAAKRQYLANSSRGRWVIFNRDDFTCFYCGKRSYEGAELAVDHVMPYIKGGKHVASNLVTCCRWCNSEKSTDPVLDLDGVLAEVRARNLRAGLDDDQRIRLQHRERKVHDASMGNDD